MTLPPTLHVGVSTKAYFGWHRSLEWLDAVAALLAERGVPRGVELFVIPSGPVLPAAIERLAPLGVTVGAQDVAWGDGPLTGETPPAMLAELGVTLVEVGHAERRRLFGEDGAVVRRKVAAALDHGLRPLLCIGETEHADPETAAQFCVGQVLEALGERPGDIRHLALAYEPVWAIGAERPADAAHVQAVVRNLRAALASSVGDPAWVVYGGSAGPGLLGELDAVDGLFLGRRAHDPANLTAVIEEATRRLSDEHDASPQSNIR